MFHGLYILTWPPLCSWMTKKLDLKVCWFEPFWDTLLWIPLDILDIRINICLFFNVHMNIHLKKDIAQNILVPCYWYPKRYSLPEKNILNNILIYFDLFFWISRDHAPPIASHCCLTATFWILVCASSSGKPQSQDTLFQNRVLIKCAATYGFPVTGSTSRWAHRSGTARGKAAP